jgi:hypothetical protein
MRRKFLAAFLLLGALAISAPLTPAHADDAARAIIRAQEEAISADDGAKAYSYAAPSIQAIFPDPDIFMSMVKRGYAPLYQPRVFDFGASRNKGGRIEELVHIIDADGVAWTALYQLEVQSDGSLKITGCTLVKSQQSA